MADTATYEYSVRDRAGKIVSGTLEADSPGSVATKLRAMGYAPVSINRSKAGMSREITIPGFGNKVKLKDLAIMSRQFATMINSGLSMMRALSILSEQTENKTLAKVLAQVRGEVESGSALSAALAKHHEIFPPLMINMCKAGEVGGFLDTVLLQVAKNFESDMKLRSKIKSAMTYPVVVFCIAILAVMGMLLFVVPTFVKMFEQLGGKLPLPTRILVALSHAATIGVPVLVVLAIIFPIVWKKIKHEPWVRNVLDPFKIKVMIFGPLFHKVALSRFSRNLGSMLRAGVPILQALDIVAETTGNVVLERAVRDVQDSVRRGESLTQPLNQHDVFPAMVVQMMAVGEDTGAIDSMLDKISEFYDQQVEATAEALTSLIEPLMIAFLGGVVGSMIVALYMPIFKVVTLVQS